LEDLVSGNAIAAANHSLSLAGWIPGKAQPGLELVHPRAGFSELRVVSGKRLCGCHPILAAGSFNAACDARISCSTAMVRLVVWDYL